MLLALVVALGSGILSFLAPCTVPLLPAYVGVLSGSSGSFVRGSLLYVLGFGSVFVTLGAVAGGAGSAVREAGGPVQRAGGVLVLLMAAALLLESRLGLLARLTVSADGTRARLARSTSWAAPLLLGVVFGTAFTPCVGPFLGSVLAFAATSGGAGTGALLLSAYALGLGVPFVLAGLALAASPALSQRLKPASRWVSLVGAVVLVLLGLALVTGGYGAVAGSFARLLPSTAV
ncbi:MAG: cytochrome c biogenesis protein CcdA [Mycobacteriales bacterium]